MSRPMRARGLKPENTVDIKRLFDVAPHAGAWIETPDRNPPTQCLMVAPHAGAWIETYSLRRGSGGLCVAPMRARGLKRIIGDAGATDFGRAPCGRVD